MVAHRSGGAARVGMANTPASAVAAVGAVADIAASPVVQGIAAVVTAGVLALGVGTAAVRRDAAPPGPAHFRPSKTPRHPRRSR